MPLVDILFGWMSLLLSAAALGLAIGFSPLVYGTFVATLTQPQSKRWQLQTALIGGVLAAVILLLLFGAGLAILVEALKSSVLYYLLIGGAGVGLIGYAVRRNIRPATAQKPKPKAYSPTAIAAIGFSKTILSALSLAAALMASTLFASIGDQPAILLMAALVICLAAIAPFVVVRRSRSLTRRARSWLEVAQKRMAHIGATHNSLIAIILLCCGFVLVIYALTH